MLRRISQDVVTLGAQAHELTKGCVSARPILVAFFTTANNNLDGTVALPPALPVCQFDLEKLLFLLRAEQLTGS